MVFRIVSASALTGLPIAHSGASRHASINVLTVRVIGLDCSLRSVAVVLTIGITLACGARSDRGGFDKSEKLVVPA